MIYLYRSGRYPDPQFTRCCQLLADDDLLLLIENGVYLWRYQDETLLQLAKEQRLFILADDIRARAIEVPEKLQISLGQWVRLTEKHPQSVTWPI